MGHGWMAVKWILAGEPASAVLVTSLLLVAVNTQMLVTVVQIAHLRKLLLKLGITKNVRVKFSGIGNLMRVGAGRSCVAINVVATSLLVVHLKDRMFQLITWLLTALGTVMWANATLEGIGSSAWNDIKEFATADAGTMEVEDFLDELEAEKDPEQGRTCNSCPFMSQLVDMSKEDQLLLKNHALLLHHAFPSLPKLRFVHGVMFMLLNLCCFAVPAALLGLCFLEVPRLQDISLVGATLHPSKVSLSDGSSHYYINLQDGWKADVLLTFQLRVGQASTFQFCCTSGCSKPKDSEHGDTLLLTSNITASDFGTCNLKLYGMRFRQYDFTVLALQGLEISSLFGTATGDVQPFDVHLKNYNVSFTSQEKEGTNLTLDVTPQVERNTKVRYDARSCSNQSCTASQWQRLEAASP